MNHFLDDKSLGPKPKQPFKKKIHHKTTKQYIIKFFMNIDLYSTEHVVTNEKNLYFVNFIYIIIVSCKHYTCICGSLFIYDD